MERAMMRRKRQRNHRRSVSVIAALFLALQLTVMSLAEAYAAQDSSMETEIYGCDGQDEEQNKGLDEEEIEYDDIEDRDGDSFENRNVSVSSIPNTPDNQGEDTEAEAENKGDDGEAVEKTGVFDLTVETNECLTVLCFPERKRLHRHPAHGRGGSIPGILPTTVRGSGCGGSTDRLLCIYLGDTGG